MHVEFDCVSLGHFDYPRQTARAVIPRRIQHQSTIRVVAVSLGETAERTTVKMATAKLIRQGQLKLGVHLELSMEEAKTLILIFDNIGGDPQRSRRKHTEDIDHALMMIGIDFTAEEEAEIIQGEDEAGITFANFSPKPVLLKR